MYDRLQCFKRPSQNQFYTRSLLQKTCSASFIYFKFNTEIIHIDTNISNGNLVYNNNKEHLHVYAQANAYIHMCTFLSTSTLWRIHTKDYSIPIHEYNRLSAHALGLKSMYQVKENPSINNDVSGTLISNKGFANLQRHCFRTRTTANQTASLAFGVRRFPIGYWRQRFWRQNSEHWHQENRILKW